jgi:peroxiredoxin
MNAPTVFATSAIDEDNPHSGTSMKSTTVPVGKYAPQWELLDGAGQVHRLDALDGDKILLVFFRGFWCESCQTQLGLMTSEHQDIIDRGAVTVAISADSAEPGGALPFLVLSDPDLRVIRRYGVLHQPDDNGPGIARPSVFLLDRSRTVRYAYIGVDANDRPKLEALLLALDSI